MVLGGPHPSLLPDEAALHADVVVVGHAEQAWADFTVGHEEDGRLLSGGRWWLHPDFRFHHATFVPARMTPRLPTEASWEARIRFNGLGSRLSRLLEPRTNLRNPMRMALHWGYNGLFCRELVREQGMKLGIQEGAAPRRGL